jgi:hypothetical protein
MDAILKTSVFFLAALLTLATATATPTIPATRTNFDGNWSVLIVTTSGPCERAYRYGISIRNGLVTNEGSASVSLTGRVSKNGAVSVRVWAGSQSASGAGRLSRGYGSGRWHGADASDSCAGSWTAERR